MSTSTLCGMLANRFYTGRVEFEGTYIRAQHDAVVSDVLFQSCIRAGEAPSLE